MAGRGPAPKAGAVRSRPTLHTLPAEGYSGPYPPLEGRHTEATQQWYVVWARSPQAHAFEATDWQRLQQLAFVVDELYEPTITDRGNRATPVTAVLAEIRQQEANLGATIRDRMSLYMTIKEAEEASQAAEAPQAQRRSRLRAVESA